MLLLVDPSLPTTHRARALGVAAGCARGRPEGDPGAKLLLLQARAHGWHPAGAMYTFYLSYEKISSSLESFFYYFLRLVFIYWSKREIIRGSEGQRKREKQTLH